VLVKYVFVVEPSRQDAEAAPAQVGTSWLPLSPVATLPLPSGRLSTNPAALQGHPLLSSPAFSPEVQVRRFNSLDKLVSSAIFLYLVPAVVRLFLAAHLHPEP
jgi:hypothetical protein